MINRNILMSGIAAVILTAGTTASFAQADPALYRHGVHHATGKAGPHALTVRRMAAPAPVDPIGAVAGAIAAPFNAVGAVGGPVIGTGAGVVGSTIGGVGAVVAAPFAGLSGTAPGISSAAAPPLPIKARYAKTGAVASTYDEGFAQDVPVDMSGPIYMIDNTGHDRTVTPFSLLAFPVAATTYAVTAPLRAVAPHP